MTRQEYEQLREIDRALGLMEVLLDGLLRAAEIEFAKEDAVNFSLEKGENNDN